MDATSYLLGKKAGGGSGTSNYNDLSNKPSINGVTLSGNKSTSDLGIVIPDISGKQDKIDSTHKLDADLVDDTNSTNKMVSASDKTTWSGKQDALVSGTNIKTINNESILGSGNITISGGGGAEAKVYWLNVTNIPTYTTITDQTILKTFDDMLNDYKAGNVVFFEDRTSASNNVKRFFIASMTYTSSGNEVLVFDEITRNLTYSNSIDFYKGYTTNNMIGTSISFNYGTKSCSMSNTDYSTVCYIDPSKEYAIAFTPTKEYHPASKKYVDNKITSYTGYDATKTQVLKNVNGTLTWVDE